MLPFIKPKSQQGGVIVQERKRDENVERGEQDEEMDDLKAAAQDLINAIHSKDSRATAEAFKAIFEICESYPEAAEEPDQAEEAE